LTTTTTTSKWNCPRRSSFINNATWTILLPNLSSNSWEGFQLGRHETSGNDAQSCSCAPLHHDFFPDILRHHTFYIFYRVISYWNSSGQTCRDILPAPIVVERDCTGSTRQPHARL
jgi:hypothetical protein